MPQNGLILVVFLSVHGELGSHVTPCVDDDPQDHSHKVGLRQRIVMMQTFNGAL